MTNHYHWLARYYDQVFAFAPAYGEPARRKILGPILPGVKAACDLACGTGTTAVALARMGIRVFGVDLSAAMCRAAREKARGAGVKLRVIRADMREFRLPQPVDLVTCEFDALNHVPEERDLARVARRVARALHSGGHFYFDVNNSLAFKKLWPSAWWIEKRGVVLVMHGGHDPERDRGFSDVEWFIREGGLWRRRRERVEEVCWTAAEIRRTLRAAGFRRIRAWDAAPLLKHSDPSLPAGCRTYYLAQKA